MKYISQKDTNVIIRKALKEKFPGVKFSVVGSDGATNIDWTDGPSDNAVYEFKAQFEGASYDGMTDMESTRYGTHEGEQVVFGAKYVFTHRSVSIGAYAEGNALIGTWGVPANATDFETPTELYVMRQGLMGRTGQLYPHTYRSEVVRLIAEYTAMQKEQDAA
jgi:hypothetical protein